MFYDLGNLVAGFWRNWAGLFEPLPFGDPYIAGATLFVIAFVTAKILSGRFRRT